jgi:hypothetical protein
MACLRFVYAVAAASYTRERLVSPIPLAKKRPRSGRFEAGPCYQISFGPSAFSRMAVTR